MVGLRRHNLGKTELTMRNFFDRIDGTIWEELFLVLVLFLASLLGIFAWVWLRIKRMLPILLILATWQPAHAQKIQWARVGIGSGLMFAAGAANGTNEAISHHYGAFQKRFPNANPQYWNPAESWRNKYLDGSPENGPAFPGSMNIGVNRTDAYHLTNGIHTAGLTLGTITLTIGQKRPAWQYFVEFATGMAAYSAGNYLTYNVLFKQ